MTQEPYKITDPAQYEAYVRRARLNTEYQMHVMSECPGCGWCRWLRSEPASEKVVIFSPMDPNFDTCNRCAIVRERAPEIYAWVAGISDKIRGDLARAIREGNS